MHATAIGVVAAGRSLHWPLAKATLHTLAANTPGDYGSSMHASHAFKSSDAEQWIAAVSACAHAAATGGDNAQRVQDLVTELLQGIRPVAEDLTEFSGSFSSDPHASDVHSGASSSHRELTVDLLSRIRWRLLLVSYVSWHMHAHHAQCREVLTTANFISVGSSEEKVGGLGSRTSQHLQGHWEAWETPLRLFYRTIDCLVRTDDGSQKMHSEIVQGLFTIWRELQVAGCSACTANVLRDALVTVWKLLNSQDQILLAPFLIDEL